MTNNTHINRFIANGVYTLVIALSVPLIVTSNANACGLFSYLTKAIESTQNTAKLAIHPPTPPY
ncbi:hypothetical protein H0X48_02695 [Candidatus Dependentiae bacterium]|nr:hypothetical protein [Candidatus Dependentiae bacterium]